ncbi:hypothetical protein T439DRAFT_311266 [Meredithblackwellia eburnea MCA 4105]
MADENYDDNEGATTQTQTQTQADPFQRSTYTQGANIFDDDSDLSDIDDDEDAPSPPPLPQTTTTTTDDKESSPHPDDDDDHRSPSPPVASSDDDDDDDGETYQPDKDKGKGKGKGKRSASASEAEPEGDGDGEGGLSSLKFKKKKRSPSSSSVPASGVSRRKSKKARMMTGGGGEEDEDEPEMDEETRRRKDLDERLNAIIKKPKNKQGGRRKRGGDEEDLEALNDESIIRLRNDMYLAADADIEENEAGRFAYHKLRLLPQVVQVMQRVGLAESLVENGILDAVKRWLEPLPDHSLPAINVQRPIFEILRTLSIETSALKSSGLGKVVYFYTKCKRVEPFIQRMANQLVSDWMRPILRRSKLFTDRQNGSDPTVSSDEDDVRRRRPVQAQAQASRSTNETIARRHARIPEMLTSSFKNSPVADVRERERGGVAGGERMLGGAASQGSKMKSYKKKLVAGQVASRRI